VSGNIGSADGQPSIFDPASYWGHHEAAWGVSINHLICFYIMIRVSIIFHSASLVCYLCVRVISRCHGVLVLVPNSGRDIDHKSPKMLVFMTENHCTRPIIN
jgi:hypothetical protein